MQDASTSASQKTVHDDDHDEPESCRVLSAALSGIIKRSVSDDFREHCFSMLKTDSTLDARTAVADNLLSLVSRDSCDRSEEIQTKTTKSKATRPPLITVASDRVE